MPKQLLPRAEGQQFPASPWRRSEARLRAGYDTLAAFNQAAATEGREILDGARATTGPASWCWRGPITWIPASATRSKPTSRPMAIPILWVQYLPIDPDLMDWLFGEDISEARFRPPFDIRDVWPSSYSGNTNEILWGAKVAARLPWVSCVIRLTSYECGMDQPTFTPVQQDRRAFRDRCSFRSRTSTPPSRRDRSRSGSRRSPIIWSVLRRASSRARRSTDPARFRSCKLLLASLPAHAAAATGIDCHGLPSKLSTIPPARIRVIKQTRM